MEGICQRPLTVLVGFGLKFIGFAGCSDHPGMLTIFVELPQCLNAHRYVAYDIYDMYTMNIQRNLLVKIERISKRNPGVFLVALSLPSRLF